MLGVTQASVSLYLSNEPNRAYSLLASLSLGKEEADRYAALLAEDLKRNPVYAVQTLTSLWKGLLGSGLVCDAHREMYPSLSQCDVCIKEYGGRKAERSGLVSEVAEAVKLLEASRAFVNVMPEVSVNLAFAAENADSVEDVVAIPGRIVRVKGNAKALSRPEFGASGHLARVLLLVRSRRPRLRAAVNLKYDSRIRSLLKRLGLRTLVLGGYESSGIEDPTLRAVARTLRTASPNFVAMVDPGGPGVEPNTYLFTASAREAAKLAVKLAELYSSN